MLWEFLLHMLHMKNAPYRKDKPARILWGPFLTSLIFVASAVSPLAQGDIHLPDPSEAAYFQMLEAFGIQRRRALAEGQEMEPQQEMSQRTGIIGQDRRRRLNFQELRQHSGVAAIFSERADSEGTGFLVCDGSVLLTSAHIFYDNTGRLKGPLDQFEVFLKGPSGDFQQFGFDSRPGSYRVGRTTELRTHGHQDWMLLRLRTRPNSRQFQPLKVSTQNEVLKVQNQAQSDIRVVGFLNGESWDVMSSTCPNFRSTQSSWQYSTGSLNVLYSHDCSTEGGASGSPVIQGSCQGTPRVIAIHSGGHPEFRAEFDQERPWRNNYATPISPEILTAMEDLCGPSYSQAICTPAHQVAHP